MISRNLLLELKQILEEDFNLKLSLEQVMEIGTILLAYVETLLKIESASKGGVEHA
ncbi:MAG: hypothetical protein UT24_C0005G0055 [Candidatus Woesebacteria bacterium GW2011_GWB1_39_12]|uniref:Uncharacterized protein n=2 Tax=Candidatus Woeseibacteriota TaxID=1752722 RepID=A0A0G0Q8K8_9BACT|nr:MAG: hypothetical protein UT23_C0006G0077 [Candidatus Woesebacteria bacterium GW2011_GWA1_39_12]KKR01346.1 MAG: hypothetical protein UT24_C0005G0055 [Candidatus Woesebacteria bacterium GW2011_GWB1_39_12]